jgi:hypothetical protein
VPFLVAASRISPVTGLVVIASFDKSMGVFFASSLGYGQHGVDILSTNVLPAS